MVTMTCGRSPPAAGRSPAARAALQAPTRPSRCRCGRVRWSSRSAAASPSRRRHPRRRLPVAGPAGTRRRCSGPRVGGDVHDGEQVFELVCRGEDFQVVQASAGPPDEGALPLVQFLLAGFVAVLVQGIRPALGDPRQEVLVVLGCCPGQGMLHPGRCLGRAGMPDTVQGETDDGRRPRGDVPGQTTAASSSLTAGSDWPDMPVRGRMSAARASRRRASAALIRSRARRNSTVFRYPSSTHSGEESAASVSSQAGSAANPAGALRPVVQPVSQPAGAAEPNFPAAVLAPAAAWLRVRSTAPAATSCRESTKRDNSSTRPAKSEASVTPNSAASGTAVALQSAAAQAPYPEHCRRHPSRLEQATAGKFRGVSRRQAGRPVPG